MRTGALTDRFAPSTFLGRQQPELLEIKRTAVRMQVCLLGRSKAAAEQSRDQRANRGTEFSRSRSVAAAAIRTTSFATTPSQAFPGSNGQDQVGGLIRKSARISTAARCRSSVSAADQMDLAIGASHRCESIDTRENSVDTQTEYPSQIARRVQLFLNT